MPKTKFSPPGGHKVEVRPGHTEPLFERRHYQEEPKNGPGVVRTVSFVLFLMFCAAVTGVLILFAAFGEGFSAGSLKRVSSLFSRSFQRGAQISSDVIFFDSQPGNVIEPYLDGIAVLTSNRLVCYDTVGGERLAAERVFKRPALQVSTKNVLAYDRNGTTLLLANRGGFLIDTQWERPIITARLNRSGWAALVTQGSGYKSVVHVFDAGGNITFKYYSPEYYIVDAAVSPDGSLLAVACAGFRDNWVSGRLRVFDLKGGGGEVTPDDVTVMVADTEDAMITELFFPQNDRIAGLTENGAVFWDAGGVELGRAALAGRALQDWSALDEALVLRTARNRSGSGARLETYRWDGEPLGSLPLPNEVICQSGGGGYVTLVTADSITVYDAELETVSEQPNLTHVRAVRQRGGDGSGSVYLLYNDNARLYTP